MQSHFFSEKEREFIFNSEDGEAERFFLLWTRKEALLKALGTGLINNLTQIEVSESENVIDGDTFSKIETDHVFNDLFIYSNEIGNNYISIAVLYKSSFDFFQINSTNIDYFI